MRMKFQSYLARLGVIVLAIGFLASSAMGKRSKRHSEVRLFPRLAWTMSQTKTKNAATLAAPRRYKRLCKSIDREHLQGRDGFQCSFL